MKPRSFMLIAGEPSGDLLGAELVNALRVEFTRAGAIVTSDYQPLYTSLEPRFFGAGGPSMAAAGVELAFDMTKHSVVGFSDVVRNYLKFRRLFNRLYHLAVEREPDAIICVDFSEFNSRFAHTIKQYVRSRRDWFHDWNPKIIRYVSPQVWASREGRAYQIARDHDLLLSILPFEKDLYAKRVPGLRVRFVGHPIVERYAHAKPEMSDADILKTEQSCLTSPTILLLPGSRADELRRHLPVMRDALAVMRSALRNPQLLMVLPDATLLQQAKALDLPNDLSVQIGGIDQALRQADLAIASTGTVTLECALFRVPAVAIYKTSWSSYQIARRMAKVKYLALPNLLAKEEIFPEFIQDAATPGNIAGAALELLRDQNRRAAVKAKLAEIVSELGPPGASRRAAREILQLVDPTLLSPREATESRTSSKDAPHGFFGLREHVHALAAPFNKSGVK